MRHGRRRTARPGSKRQTRTPTGRKNAPEGTEEGKGTGPRRRPEDQDQANARSRDSPPRKRPRRTAERTNKNTAGRTATAGNQTRKPPERTAAGAAKTKKTGTAKKQPGTTRTRKNKQQREPPGQRETKRRKKKRTPKRARDSFRPSVPPQGVGVERLGMVGRRERWNRRKGQYAGRPPPGQPLRRPRTGRIFRKPERAETHARNRMVGNARGANDTPAPPARRGGSGSGLRPAPGATAVGFLNAGLRRWAARPERRYNAGKDRFTEGVL